MKNDMFEKIKNMGIEEVLNKYFSENDPSRIVMKELLEYLLDWIMFSEREIFLEKNENDKGNGFYDRTLTTPAGKLEISVPRTRNSNFRPNILPDKYKRFDQSYTDLLMSLVANGYSESSLINTLKSLNLPYSEEELNKIKDDLKEKLELFKQRELCEEAFALIIDAYQCEIREGAKVKKATCYIVLGIDMEGKKDIYGIYTFFGRENKENWNEVFEDLVMRGLKRVLIVVSDDFPGIIDTVQKVYPLSDHQLCLVHLQRNVRRHMNKEDASSFNREISKLKAESSLEEVEEKFRKLCEGYRNKYSRFINGIIGKARHYFAFIKYPYEIRRYIYTTNSVESVNSMIERIRIKSGGYFNSIENLEINIYLQRENLVKTKWRFSVPKIKAYSYEINQIFQLRYLYETQNS